MEAHDSALIARRVIDSASASQCDYAVFVGRSVEFVPVGGKRFSRLSIDPARMAQCVGIFGPKSDVSDVRAAIELVRA